MSRFRKSEPREVPTLNTSALPDLIFTCLFFFMIVTHFRPVSVMTQLELPRAAELQKLKEKSLVVYIMVGKKQDDRTLSPAIQLNSDFVILDEMSEVLENLKKEVSSEDRDKMVAILRIDKDTPMGIVNDIKKVLRKSNLLTVHYSADKKRL